MVMGRLVSGVWLWSVRWCDGWRKLMYENVLEGNDVGDEVGERESVEEEE